MSGRDCFLMIGGGLVYKFKKAPLCGDYCDGRCFFPRSSDFCLEVFFGFEDVLPALWIRPIDHMTTFAVSRKAEYGVLLLRWRSVCF